MAWPFSWAPTSGFGPSAFRDHGPFRDTELAVFGLGRRGVLDAQGGARAGRQDDGGDLMGGEAVVDRGPGGVDALIE